MVQLDVLEGKVNMLAQFATLLETVDHVIRIIIAS